MEITHIRRGNSVIKFIDAFIDELIEYSVAPEDEADFKGLKHLFRPPPPCKWVVVGDLLVKEGCPLPGQ